MTHINGAKNLLTVIINLDDMENLEKLFFELASRNRLTILTILSHEHLKMQEIANRLNITATEVFRQLQRLSAASLVQRLPSGAYKTTEYGRLILHLSSSINFVSRHREYFLEHDLWALPGPFINRIGELREATLLDTIACVIKSIQIFLDAEEYAWGISERGKGPDYLDPLVEKQIMAGLPFRLLIPDVVLPNALAQNPNRNIEIRGFKDCPVIIVLNEKESMVAFNSVGGRIDYVGFHGDDPVFMNWAKDLFTYYWERGSRI